MSIFTLLFFVKALQVNFVIPNLNTGILFSKYTAINFMNIYVRVAHKCKNKHLEIKCKIRGLFLVLFIIHFHSKYE